MAQYLSVVDLFDLDGLNGFQINNAAGAVSFAGDVNGDGIGDMISGSSFGDTCGVLFGQTSGFTSVEDIDAVNGSDGFRFAGDGYGAFWAVAGAGDINGDGFDDIVVGDRSVFAGVNVYTGAAYVVFGQASGFDPMISAEDLDGNNGFRMDAEAYSDQLGNSVGGAGDVNGDGIDDFMIGADRADPHGSSSGATYVVFGNASGFGSELDLATLSGISGFQISGELAGDNAGRSVSAADVNGDGFSDLIVGASGADPNGLSSGATYVVFGKASGFGAAVELSGLDGNNGFQLNGESASHLSGRAVSSAGDINADGFEDVIIGAFGGDVANALPGTAYVVFGKAGGFAPTMELSALDGANGFQIDGKTANDDCGISVASAGDFNGDGFGDVIVGAPGADPNGDRNAGEAYVVFGTDAGFGAAFDLDSLDGNNGFQIDGEGIGGRAGSSVSAADLNGDGFSDIIVATQYAGTSYVVYGSPPGEAVTRNGTDIGNTIHGGGFDDTLSGLGGDDTLLGEGGGDTIVGGSGKDSLEGGGGNDVLDGGNARDVLDGGIGADVFVYASAAESTSKKYDTVKGANFAADTFNLESAITSIDATIAAGTLSKSSFDADLAAAADAAHLAVNHAVLFTPDVGNLAGKTILVVDLNGAAGYQAGGDLVLRLENAVNLASLGVEDFI
jgi:hypothetical protein